MKTGNGIVLTGAVITLTHFRYIVSFLLDSSVGLLVIYACIRLTVRLADRFKWPNLYFGEYGEFYHLVIVLAITRGN